MFCIVDLIIIVCVYVLIFEFCDVIDVNKELGCLEIECDKLKGIFVISLLIYI